MLLHAGLDSIDFYDIALPTIEIKRRNGMKSLLVLAVLCSSTIALACMPSGDLLSAPERATFSKDLAASSPTCFQRVTSKVGNLNSREGASVYENAQDNAVEYTVLGKSMEISLTKIRVAGKIRYSCGQPTGLKRCRSN